MSAFTEVRGATRDDVVAVARIHKARFGTADYTLGQFSFSLIGKFYAAFLGRCVFLVHVSDGRIDGFVVGGLPSEIFAVQRRFELQAPAAMRFGSLVPSPSLAGCLPLHPKIVPAAANEVRAASWRRTCRDCSPSPWTRLPKAAAWLRHWSGLSNRVYAAVTPAIR